MKVRRRPKPMPPWAREPYHFAKHPRDPRRGIHAAPDGHVPQMRGCAGPVEQRPELLNHDGEVIVPAGGGGR